MKKLAKSLLVIALGLLMSVNVMADVQTGKTEPDYPTDYYMIVEMCIRDRQIIFIYLPDIPMQRWRKCLPKRWINRQKKHRTVEKMRSEPCQRTRIRQEQSMKL